MNLSFPSPPTPAEDGEAQLSPKATQADARRDGAQSWQVHVDCVTPLENHEFFFDGWLKDPTGQIAKAFLRIGHYVSEELLAVAARYPRPELGAGLPSASPGSTPSGSTPSDSASSGLAARLLVQGRELPPGVAKTLPPSDQAELILVMKDHSVHVQRPPLTQPAALLERASAPFRLATRSRIQRLGGAKAARRKRRGPLHVALRAFMAVWHAIRRLFFGVGPDVELGDLTLRQQLIALDPKQDEWLAVGPDPAFRCRKALSPGYYMLEVEMVLSRPRARPRVYFDVGQGETESSAATLWVRDRRRTKRLLQVTEHAHLRFDPTDFPGRFTIRHFRLAGVSRSFALDRMRQKLASSGLVKHPDQLDAAELRQRYDGLFSSEAHVGISYEDWIRNVEAPARPDVETQLHTIATWTWQPKISIVTPTHNTPLPFLRACAESVRGQSYPNWEWCIADDASRDPAVRACLEELAASDSRIRVTFREENGHISRASNSALELASGEFIALLDHDDTLALDALFHVVQALQDAPDAGIVYSDEDKLDDQGYRCDPYFKPDWSPELLLGQNYVCHLVLYRRSLVTEAGGFRAGFEGSQDYDLLLRCSRLVSEPKAIVHIPRVLYHWRKSAASVAGDATQKSYATDAAVRALTEHAAAGTEKRDRITVVAPGLYRHHWPLPDAPPLVSIIIATRDAHALLHRCVTTLVERTKYPAYELIIVDNQSTCPETLAYLAELEAEPKLRVRLLRYDAPFNYSAINNAAARAANGEILVLLNNDIEIISEGWLSEMVSYCLRPRVGCVGAKLCYPDNTIQHAGVVLGIGGVAGHSHKHFDRSADGYFSRLRIAHEVSAVTGAALAVRKEVYAKVGGLDEENLSVAFNDVDFCLKVGAEGYTNIFTPFAELYHHESRSRGIEDTPVKQARFTRECATMRKRWGQRLDHDPYYNPNLSHTHEDYSLSPRPLSKPWRASRPERPGFGQSEQSEQPESAPRTAGTDVPAGARRGHRDHRPSPQLAQPLLFVHIPKTAGTSLRVAAERVFRDRMLLDYGSGGKATSPEIQRFVYDEPDLWALRRLLWSRRIGMLSGHISYAKYAEIFEPEQVVVVLRDPVERVVSHYHHELRHHDYTGSLLEFARRPGNRNVQSRITRRLDLSRAGLVGIAERYSESLRLLAYRTGLELEPLEINANPDRSTPSKYDLTAKERRALLRWNERDMTLYREADKLLTESLARCSLDSQSETSAEAGPGAVEQIALR